VPDLLYVFGILAVFALVGFIAKVVEKLWSSSSCWRPSSASPPSCISCMPSWNRSAS